MADIDQLDGFAVFVPPNYTQAHIHAALEPVCFPAQLLGTERRMERVAF
jgi:hypothetical protein